MMSFNTMEIGLGPAERVGQGEVSLGMGAVCMVVVVAGCRKVLVDTGRAISLLCRGLHFWHYSFPSGGVFTVLLKAC